MSFGFALTGGSIFNAPTSPTATNNPGKQEIVFSSESAKKNLQLQTFTVKNTCQQTLAVDFLIDISGSMKFGDKQPKEKEALNAFTSRMGETSVIGIQTFSSNVYDNVQISYLKDVRNQVQSTISGLTADGATSTRDALKLAQQKLSAAITQKKFPGYKYSLVLLTDGVPEAAGLLPYDNQKCLVTVPDAALGGDRCFAKIQDPRGTPTDPTNIASQIKNLGVDIYSIGLTSENSSDKTLQPYLEALLQDVASQPLSTHYYTSLNGENLTNVLNNVLSSICKE